MLYPSLAEFKAWLRPMSLTGSPTADDDVIAEDLESARLLVLAECDAELLPTPPNCPAPVRRAIMMRAAQLLAERGGNAASPDVGGAVPMRWDGAIADLLAPYAAGPDPECG